MKYNEMTYGRSEAVFNKLGGEEGIQRFLSGELILVNSATSGVARSVFERITPFTVPSASEFVAAKKFVRNTSEDARVRISYIGPTFEKVMLPKVERNLEGGERKLSQLLEAAHDLSQGGDKPGIIHALGGMPKARTSLHDFYETLAYKQARGDRSWTVGYADDVNGSPWAVGAHWRGDGWDVEAFSVGGPIDWDAGCEFVSR